MGIFFWTKILDFLGFSLACLTELCSFGYAKKFLSPGTRKVSMTSLNANFDDVISGTMHYLIACGAWSSEATISSNDGRCEGSECQHDVIISNLLKQETVSQWLASKSNSNLLSAWKLLKKYILSGQPSGCFSLCPDLRKSTTSIPPNPEYGIKPELKVRKETLLDEWFPHFTLGWLWILGSRDC